MKTLRKIDGILGKISEMGAWVAGAALFSMAALIFVNIFMRYFFKASIKGADEIVTILMVVVVYFALPVSTRIRAHVRVDFITNLFPEAIRNFILALTAWACIFITVNITIRTWQNAATIIRTKNVTPILKLSPAPFYYMISILCVLLTLEFFADGYKYAKAGVLAIRRRKHPELEEGRDETKGADEP